MSHRKYSLLYPAEQAEYKTLSQTTMHDLGLDQICKKLSAKEAEQNYILNVMARMYADPVVTQYRCDIFEDVLQNKKMRDDMMEILGRISFLKDYGGFKGNTMTVPASGICCTGWMRSTIISNVWMHCILVWRIRSSTRRDFWDCGNMWKKSMQIMGLQS